MKRKTISIFVIFMMFTVSLFSQDAIPQKVYSLVKEKQSVEWYKIQAELWGKQLTANPEDAYAWLNYYTAKRMLKIYGEGVTHEDLNNFVLDLEKALPNSFEYHYIAYWNKGLSEMESHLNHLKKAQQLGPDRIELFDDLFTYYEVTRDVAKAKNVAKKWFASNDISAGLYTWNYNMLESTDANAILITTGDNDTYPSLVMQYAKGIRTDVTVLNISMASISGYQQGKFKELGIPAMISKQSDYICPISTFVFPFLLQLLLEAHEYIVNEMKTKRMAVAMFFFFI
ncbi:MAG: hypothetical protein ACI8ZN_001020 [Bacteroidia bacterium]|jgi:hypothetical protein